MGDQQQASFPQRGRRKTMVGKVVSENMNKTVVILVERLQMHPLYDRVIKRSKKLLVHDEKNECHVGDLIKVRETRPLSKRKRWLAVEVQEKAK